jgi:hypothetical protein
MLLVFLRAITTSSSHLIGLVIMPTSVGSSCHHKETTESYKYHACNPCAMPLYCIAIGHVVTMYVLTCNQLLMKKKAK